MVRMWRTASTTLPVPASPLVRIMAAPSPIRRSASPRLRAPHTKGVVKAHLSMWMLLVGRGEHLGLVDVVDLERFQHPCLEEVADAGLGHHGDADRRLDLLDLGRIGHAGDAALLADVGGTRSRAMTATAPASSAMIACSALTTSMMTPPLSISARPLLTSSVPRSTVTPSETSWYLARCQGRFVDGSVARHHPGPVEASCRRATQPSVLLRFGWIGEQTHDRFGQRRASPGGTRVPFPSSTCRKAGRSLATTAQPAAIASATTMPKLSPLRLGATKNGGSCQQFSACRRRRPGPGRTPRTRGGAARAHYDSSSASGNRRRTAGHVSSNTSSPLRGSSRPRNATR
jgi:hypothetical protein